MKSDEEMRDSVSPHWSTMSSTVECGSSIELVVTTGSEIKVLLFDLSLWLLAGEVKGCSTAVILMSATAGSFKRRQ